MPHAHPSGFPSPCVLLSDCIPPVVQDRLKLWHVCQAILNRSGAGAPELQRECPVDQDRLILIRSGAGAPELQRWA